MHSSHASLLCVLSMAVLSCTDAETNPAGPSAAPATPVGKIDTTKTVDTTTKVPDTTKPRATGMQLGAGGYVTSGSWKGYAWTLALVTGSTVAPADYSAITASDTRLCAKGTVGKDPDYAGVVMVGINLNQEALPPVGAVEPPILQFIPTGTGIRYQVSNPGKSSLRIQIQDHSGTDAGRWCADVVGTSGMIAWEDFNTTCWAPATGKTYAREPLKDVSIVAPGKNTTDVPVDFCLENLSEVP